MITSVIVAHKDGETKALAAKKGDLRAEYRALVAQGGFDQIELITSANGRLKRKTIKALTPTQEPQELKEPEPTSKKKK
jgi:hypothetical protein